MPAGFAVRGILIVVAKTTSRTKHLFFCGDIDPFLDDSADLPGYEDDTWKYHKHGNPLPGFGQGRDVAEAHGCQRHHSEIECIAESLDIGVQRIFNIKEQPGRYEKYHEYG